MSASNVFGSFAKKDKEGKNFFLHKYPFSNPLLLHYCYSMPLNQHDRPWAIRSKSTAFGL